MKVQTAAKARERQVVKVPSLPALLFLVLSASIAASESETTSKAGIGQQDSPEMPPFVPRARWTEDWSILSPPVPDYDDPSLKIKHIPLGSGGENYLSLGGEYRFTYERFDPADRGLFDVGTEEVVLHRVAGHADWHLNRNWRIFGQLGYADSNGRDGGSKAEDESNANI